MTTLRAPQASSWKPLRLRTSSRCFCEKAATSLHELTSSRGSTACGGSGAGSTSQEYGMIFSSRRCWLSESSRRQSSRSGRSQKRASHAFSSSHGLGGAVMVTDAGGHRVEQRAGSRADSAGQRVRKTGTPARAGSARVRFRVAHGKPVAAELGRQPFHFGAVAGSLLRDDYVRTHGPAGKIDAKPSSMPRAPPITSGKAGA